MISANKLYLFKHLFLIFIVIGLLSSNAHANFYVVAGGGKKIGTEIKALPYTISQPGFYFITKNLTCALGNHGIVVDTDNVTIDLMGFSLTGGGVSGGTTDGGIYMNNRTNVEIRNGTIREFPNLGVYGLGNSSKGHRCFNLRILSNGNHGIYLAGYSHMVKGCTAINNSADGLSVGEGSTLTGNTCYENGGRGIEAFSGSTVILNTCRDNGSDGIYALAGSTVTNNTCRLNGANGIRTSNNCFISGNTCRDNDVDGIRASGGSSMISNTCCANGNDGIHAGSSSSIIGNTCKSNDAHGIRLYESSFVDQNLAYSNVLSNMSDCDFCTLGTNHAP